MKKKICSLLLALLMVVTMLPVTAMATDRLTTAPYAGVEYGYSASVTVGTVRYIRQNGNLTFAAMQMKTMFWIIPKREFCFGDEMIPPSPASPTAPTSSMPRSCSAGQKKMASAT